MDVQENLWNIQKNFEESKKKGKFWGKFVKILRTLLKFWVKFQEVLKNSRKIYEKF